MKKVSRVHFGGFLTTTLVLIACNLETCRNRNTLLRLAWPPEDLYEDLGEAPIDVGTAGSVVELKVVPKYDGAHDVDIHFPSKLPLDGTLQWKLRVRVEVLDGGRTIIDNSDREGSPYWSSKGGSGLCFLRAEGENEWSPGFPYLIRVSVVVPDQPLIKEYGSAKVRVAKGSDE
jgi:hypothetical protein